MQKPLSRPALCRLLPAAAAALGMFTALPAQAAVNSFVIGMLNSGTAPFDAAGGAGKDASATDTTVRTHDEASYRVGYSLTPADTGRVLTVSMGTHTPPASYTGPALAPGELAYFSVADLPTGPAGCANISTAPVAWPVTGTPTQSGVSADGQHIVCVQDGMGSGANMDFKVRVAGTAPNGTTLGAPSASFFSDSNAQQTAAVTSTGGLHGTPGLTVSAAPRWQVSKTLGPGGVVFVPGSGPGGEDGYIAPFNLGVYAQGSRKGLEALQPNFTIDDSFVTSPSLPNARLVTWNVASPYATLPMGGGGGGAEPASQNGCGDWRSQLLRLGNQFDNGYHRANDFGAQNVADRPPEMRVYSVSRGGVCTTSQGTGAATSATLNVTGTDFSLAHYPVRAGSNTGATVLVGADINASTNQWWVASKSVLVWVSVTDLQSLPGTGSKWADLTNTAKLTGTSITGQANEYTSTAEKVRYEFVGPGTFRKLYTSPRAHWGGGAADLTACDPTITTDCFVNQASPGQVVAARLTVNARASGFTNGYICDKIDNSRFTVADMRGRRLADNATTRKYTDPNTGIVRHHLSGDPTTATGFVFEYGVGGPTGNGLTGTEGQTGRTWATRSNVLNEYADSNTPGYRDPVTGSGSQAGFQCGDAEALWFSDLGAIPAGYTRQDIHSVRIRYARFDPANFMLFYVPLQVNSSYAGNAPFTETAPDPTNGNTVVTSTITPGASDINGSFAPNQAVWLAGTAGIAGTSATYRSSDALRIVQTQYTQIGKRARLTGSTDYLGNGAVVDRGSLITYELQVNLTSSSNAHTTSVVDVWDVLPQHMQFIAGSSQFGGAAITPTCYAPGDALPADAPFEAGAVRVGTACRWQLANQPVAKADRGAAAGNLPPITFQARVLTSAANSASLPNTSYADSTGNLMPKAHYPAAGTGDRAFVCVGGGTGLPCSVGNWPLTVSSNVGIEIHKAVSHAVVPVETGFSYRLTYNATGNVLNQPRLLDVLPYNGDGREVPAGSGSATDFRGALRLNGPIAAPVADASATPPLLADPDLEVRYSSNAPANINPAPHHASHDVTGTGANSASSTNWCAVSQLGSANCPAADLSDATAFMAFPRAGANVPLQPGERYQLVVNVLPAGNQPADQYHNSFRADSPSLTARNPGSEIVRTVVIGVGGRVYEEKNGNTTDNGHPADPGIAGVSVRMTCATPAYDQTVTTNAEGYYAFPGAPAGAQCTITQTQPAGYDSAYNTPGMGGTGEGSAAGSSFIQLTVPADGISRGNNFAEMLQPQQADMGVAVTCTPNPAAPGTPVTCTATCTNNGPSAALNATCSIPAIGAFPGCTAAPATSLAAGGTLSCTTPAFNMPATPLTVNAQTGAANDNNAPNNSASTNLTLPGGGGGGGGAGGGGNITAVPTLGWPALMLLAGLLGGLGMRRKRMGG